MSAMMYFLVEINCAYANRHPTVAIEHSYQDFSRLAAEDS
jgi:hypothetical protein